MAAEYVVGTRSQRECHIETASRMGLIPSPTDVTNMDSSLGMMMMTVMHVTLTSIAARYVCLLLCNNDLVFMCPTDAYGREDEPGVHIGDVACL